MKELDNIVVGMAQYRGLKSVILEMDCAEANRFLFAISKEFQEMRGTYDAVRNIVGMGEVFKYKGVAFRIVESIK